mmetsp:Transcript_20163/g.55820  ORF Transcript_20163/g.55820 Transcript_20163/m.55820 type:complete len:214 (+) Transcript_20163:109-750(+)
MEPRLHLHQTEYHRQARGPAEATNRKPAWSFSGKAWTHDESNRTREIAHGCGITPRVWGDGDARISEEPVTSRSALAYGTTALAQSAGITPRRRVIDTQMAELKRNAVAWHQHDHERSSADSKVLRPIRVAGVNTARLGWLKQNTFDRQGVDDRPHGFREDETMPGGYHFTPADPDGDPTRFGRDAHFTAKFGHARGMAKNDATFRQRPGRGF